MLAVQSQEFLAEAYEKFVEKDFDNGGSRAMAGLELLLQRYVSSSWDLRPRLNFITVSGKYTRRGILMKMMVLPWRSGKLDGMVCLKTQLFCEQRRMRLQRLDSPVCCYSMIKHVKHSILG